MSSHAANSHESLCSQVHAAVQANILKLLGQYAKREGNLLDIGCWHGQTTMRYANQLSAKGVFGIEVFAEVAEKAKKAGVDVRCINLETDSFPFASHSMDVVVCNQVFEHLKDIFRPMDEMARVLVPGGILILSVPNLASFHSRIMLLLGMQPSPIRIYGPHVRGFTLRAISEYLQSGRQFEYVKTVGSGFYPFHASGIGAFLARLWVGGSHTPIFVLRRTNEQTFSYRQNYLDRLEQTFM